jgi:hypothetical protein
MSNKGFCEAWKRRWSKCVKRHARGGEIGRYRVDEEAYLSRGGWASVRGNGGGERWVVMDE